MTQYHITGRLASGRRFKRIVTGNLIHAEGINLWRGSKWEVSNGKRKLLVRVFN